MKVVLATAISPNGLIAREDGQEDWLPAEGWSEFLVEAKRFNNVVMGRETYELVKKLYPDYNFDDVTADHKVIVSRNTGFKVKGYEVVQSPELAIEFLKQKKVADILLIGGGKLNSAFITRKLVDEIWLTITPYIIGKGRSFIAPEEFDVPLRLLEFRKLSGDRLLVKYKVTR